MHYTLTLTNQQSGTPDMSQAAILRECRKPWARPVRKHRNKKAYDRQRAKKDLRYS